MSPPPFLKNRHEPNRQPCHHPVKSSFWRSYTEGHQGSTRCGALQTTLGPRIKSKGGRKSTGGGSAKGFQLKPWLWNSGARFTEHRRRTHHAYGRHHSQQQRSKAGVGAARSTRVIDLPRPPQIFDRGIPSHGLEDLVPERQGAKTLTKGRVWTGKPTPNFQIDRHLHRRGLNVSSVRHTV